MQKINKVILITYPNSLGNNLDELEYVLQKYFSGAVGALHILPFFPSSGDGGFAPITYDKVDDKFGSWGNLKRLSKKYFLIIDYMINHISRDSKYYQDFLKKGNDSKYKNLFIDFENIWGHLPTKDEIEIIYKRKEKPPYIKEKINNSKIKKIWSTFSSEQIDLNLTTKEGLSFLKKNLISLAKNGASLIRLDAVAYAIKKAGTTCFFVEPDIWALLNECQEVLKPYHSDVLPEVHEHFSMQLKISEHGMPVYDFALPMLLLNAIYFKNPEYLSNWFSICPRNQFTTLDTHDGIGIVDVVGLLPDDEIEKTTNYLYSYGANVKRIYSTETYNNLDIYQINCTYYSALGDNDKLYEFSRAIQMFAPGVPQVYYVGMLAGKNDLKLIEETKEGRSINRHKYSTDEIDKELKRPVVQHILNLMTLRNTHPAFLGTFSQRKISDKVLILTWEYESSVLSLIADFENISYKIENIK